MRALLLSMLALLSCKVANERYCDTTHVCPAEFPVCDFDQGLCLPGGAIDAGMCVETSCPLGMPHCFENSCVQCLASPDCDGATPVCDEHVCRKCVADADCPMTLCDVEVGSCVAANEILYVAPAGGGTSCTRQAPCGKVSDAVAAISDTKHWIQVEPANYADNIAVTTNEPVHIVGPPDVPPGVNLIPSTSNNPVITVGSMADVSVRGVRITQGGMSGGDGIRCDGPNPTLLHVQQVTIDANGGAGINSSRCTVTIERSSIFDNALGGIVLFQSHYTIRNNFIYRNGTAGGSGSGTGGIRVFTLGTPSVIELNTVTGNQAMSSIGPGVQCDVPVSLGSMIVWGNGASTAVAQVGGNCAFDHSDVGGPAIPDQSNINADPQFVDASSDDYHLGPLSPCINKGQPATGVDFDGQARPNGPVPDIGADEHY